MSASLLDDTSTDHAVVPSVRNRVISWYAKPGVKVGADNLVATSLAGLVGATVASAVGGSSLEATVASAAAFNAAHPFLYGGFAASTNIALSRAGYETRTVARELSEGYASGLFLFGAYNAIVIPIQLAFNRRGVDPAQSVFWCNMVATAAITPIRGLVYYGMDWFVERAKPAAGRFLASIRGLLERDRDPEADL